MTAARRATLVCILYAIPGLAGLIYETVWIRSFAIFFGNTLFSLSTVTAIFLGGLVLGAALGGRAGHTNKLLLFGAAEIWVALYALSVPWWIGQATGILHRFYGEPLTLGLIRVLLTTLILLPATIPMGATLPWLTAWFHVQSEGRPLSAIYAWNTAGGALGAALAGLFLLPSLGFRSTLLLGGLLDVAAGAIAVVLARVQIAARVAIKNNPDPRAVPVPGLVTLVSLCGAVTMMYEVVVNRVADLLFGPTGVTVALVLATVITALAGGALLASVIRGDLGKWWAGSQTAAAILSLAISVAITASPAWLADQFHSRSAAATSLPVFEALLLAATLLPLCAASGMALPLAIRMSPLSATARLYSLNTLGAVGGVIAAGWVLIPLAGTERTLYLAAAINAGAAAFAFRKRRASVVPALVLGAVTLLLLFPQWDLQALTAGGYKYAPYFGDKADAELHRGELLFFREGAAGMVTVRTMNHSRTLAIDGKVDATDSGGDLLTEELLAHLPMSLIRRPHSVCVIGLASGVTAGSVLTWPADRVDVIEISPEVTQASRLFEAVNGKPLQNSRARLIVNDGRNHLTLTNELYDAIISEPSNPWMTGMNSLFTKEFFRIARSRLRRGGVLAQWFHLYNMGARDLRSFLKSFTEVFPTAMLWQINEGDMLITGFNGNAPSDLALDPPAPVRRDLKAVGIEDPQILPTLYVMGGRDLISFAGNAEANTDDNPLLEFHGQRNLHLQSDETNTRDLARQPRTMPTPQFANIERPPRLWVARGHMFEKAESYRLALESYRQVGAAEPEYPDALAGMLRCARTPEETAIAGTQSSRTTEALEAARAGRRAAAEKIFIALTQAFDTQPESWFNYGLFCLENMRFDDAMRNFQAAIGVDQRYLPALEALAETSLRRHDAAGAVSWSRKILTVDPTHATALKTLAAMNAQPSLRQ